MNCFNCEMGRACKSCLDLISRKETYSTDINMLKRKPANENYQTLPHHEIMKAYTNLDKRILFLNLPENFDGKRL